jgi:hypothetical protein
MVDVALVTNLAMDDAFGPEPTTTIRSRSGEKPDVSRIDGLSTRVR